MSDLLNSASLVMIPSGYKEDVVYSQIPTDGSGDLSFTRASNGTRINSAGLVEVCPWNLISYSEQFDSPFWNKGTSGSATFVVTANATTAPNGTNTADLISITRSATSELASTYTFVGQGVGTFKNTIWLKAKDSSNVGKTIDLWSWEGDTRGYTKVTLTADWVRYEQNTTVFTGTASELMDFGLLPISYSTSTTLAVEFYAWGAQSNIGSTAKPYFPTTDRLNVPRLTYQNGGGGCPSLLLEKQSTNLALYSEQFDNAAWTKYESTITANATTSPDGTQNADLLLDNSSSDAHSAYQIIIATANTYTWSVYAKAQNNNFLIISAYTGSHNRTWFNLSNGTVGTNASGNTATIESVGNGWYRCSVSRAYTLGAFIIEVSTSKTNGVSSYVGNGADGIYIWGAQLEASSYPTSYIPTTSASATRVADACFKTGIGSLIGQNEGVMFIDCVLNGTSTGGASNYGNILNTNRTANTTAAIAFLYFESTSTLTVNYFNGNGSYTPIVTLDKGSINMGDRVKIAFAYKSGDFALYVNGSLAATSTTTFTAAGGMEDIYLSDLNIYYGYPMGLKVNEQLFSKTRLTNAELASLTTI